MRIRVWHHAISDRRIVEIKFDKEMCYRSKTPPPPLLSCNRESRAECLKAYRVGSRDWEWTRFDWDTLYFKDLDNIALQCIRPGFTGYIQRRDPHDPEDISDGSDKWIGRPQHFEDVCMLAVNREVLIQTMDDYECIIRHFFPNLQVLVVLIDDGVAIGEVWNIKDNNFEIYERDWGDYPPRWEFTRACSTSFTVVSHENKHYAEFIESQMKKHFKKEEENYAGYSAPLICVMGCWLPFGKCIPDCGRWPDGWSGMVRTLRTDDEDRDLK